MPIMKFNGIHKEDIRSISTSVVDALQDLLNCPRHYFVLEIIDNTYVFEGKYVTCAPRIDVFWFDRGQEIRDQYAKIVTDKMNCCGYENLDICFFPLNQDHYYENGVHF